MGKYTMESIYLKPEYYTEVAKALRQFIKLFLTSYGISEEIADNTGKVFSNLIEYDDAYRYRLQDVMSEVSQKEMLRDPRAALKKMAGIFDKREHQVEFKFMAYIKLLNLAFYSRRFKKAFLYAVKNVNYKWLQLDAIDRYWCHRRTGYDFFGLNSDVRTLEWIKMHGGEAGLPPQVLIRTNAKD